jgi:hypothetical protein
MHRRPEDRTSLERKGYGYTPWLADEQTALASLSAMYGGTLSTHHFYALRSALNGAARPAELGSLTVLHLTEMGLLARGPGGGAIITTLGASALADYERLAGGS